MTGVYTGNEFTHKKGLDHEDGLERRKKLIDSEKIVIKKLIYQIPNLFRKH